MSTHVKNLEDLIVPSLKAREKLLSYECSNLLSVGENYGSVMLAVQVKIQGENGQEKIIHYVAKTCPPTEFLWEIFNTKVTFKKEIAVYDTIVPVLNDFGREKGIQCLMDFFSKSPGARISLDPQSNDVDKDAVLLLENLKVQGYEIGDRFTGFNEDTAKYLLRDLATMHAGVIAYRSAKPEEFRQKILPYLGKGFDFKHIENTLSALAVSIQNAAAKDPNCVPYLSKIEAPVLGLNEPIDLIENEIFATFTHNDYWVNNTMLKYENSKVIGNRMVDFQAIEYNSLANDVIFFLYTSVSLPVLKEKADELIEFYYERFIETLRNLGHDVRGYSFDSMMTEFAIMAKRKQFGHILFMLAPIMILRGKATELGEISENDVLVGKDTLHENYEKKVQFVLLDFVRRGWI